MGFQLYGVARSPGAGAQRISALDHPVFNAVKGEPIVEAAFSQLDEIGHGERHKISSQFEFNQASGRLYRGPDSTGFFH